MGVGMQHDDIYIATLFDMLNLRFALTELKSEEHFGGLDEMVALQKEFEVFRPSRSFRDSVAMLNLGGMLNTRVKNRWLKMLGGLNDYESNVAGQKGADAIVHAIIANLSLGEKALPMHFKAHDSRVEGQRIVIVDGERQPIFYIEHDYVTISLPMKPRPAAKAD